MRLIRSEANGVASWSMDEGIDLGSKAPSLRAITTCGVGAYRKPSVCMKSGNVVEVETGGIGLLRDTVVQEA